MKAQEEKPMEKTPIDEMTIMILRKALCAATDLIIAINELQERTGLAIVPPRKAACKACASCAAQGGKKL